MDRHVAYGINNLSFYKQIDTSLTIHACPYIEIDRLANPRCSVGSQTCEIWLAQQQQQNLNGKRLSVCALALVGA